MNSSHRLFIVCATLPSCVVAAVGLFAMVGNSDGIWTWRPDRVTLSEAVVTGNYAEVVAQIDRGVDPNRVADIRPSLLTARPLRITPMQAAVAGRNALMARLLLEHGVLVEPDALTVLKCINVENRAEDVKALLDELAPGAMSDCAEVKLPW